MLMKMTVVASALLAFSLKNMKLILGKQMALDDNVLLN